MAVGETIDPDRDEPRGVLRLEARHPAWGGVHQDIFTALAAPFGREEVKKRSQSGRDFHYITARTAMNRLDAVLGPENWWDEYFAQENSVLCRLTIRLPDGQILTKADAGGYAGMADHGDDDKSGYSDAFKRAAVKFGVARYLYKDGIPDFVSDRLQAEMDRRNPGPAEARQLPAPDPIREPEPARQAPPGARLVAKLDQWAKATGKGIKAWGLKWAEAQQFPGAPSKWTREQADAVYDACVKQLNSMGVEVPK